MTSTTTTTCALQLVASALLISFVLAIPITVSADASRTVAISAEEHKKQPERLRLIEEMIERGMLHKLEANREYPYLWIGPLFYALTFDQKSTVVNVVWAYCRVDNPQHDMIFLKDSHTGKKIGYYAETWGLQLD